MKELPIYSDTVNNNSGKTTFFTRIVLLACLSWLAVSCSSYNKYNTKENPYDLDIVSTVREYKKIVAEDPDKALVNLKEIVPGIQLDIKYATKDNFTHEQIYKSAEAFLRVKAANAIRDVENELKDKGLGLKIFDAYRPYAATLKFYDVVPDTNFVAAPWHGSVHNRGCAVDLTLVDLESGNELNMPTPYDYFSEKAAAAYTDLPEDVLANRQLLQDVMGRHGFEIYDYEWWHFNFHGWENYKLMDLSFEELGEVGR